MKRHSTMKTRSVKGKLLTRPWKKTTEVILGIIIKYKFLTQIIQICHVVFAPVISDETIEQLTLMIKELLRLFKTLLPGENVTPKQHYILHFPILIRRNGSLIRSSCFSYESTHNYYKVLARQQNFKNLPLSLAKRHQN